MTDQKALHGIAQDARRLIQKFGGPVFATGSQPTPISHYLLTLPAPEPIPAYFTQGLKSPAAKRVNSAYLAEAMSLKEIYEDKLRQAIQSFLEGNTSHNTDRLVSAIYSTYASLYRRSLSEWQSKIGELSRARLSSLSNTSRLNSKSPNQHGSERRVQFKSERVPILEHAYTRNAYPNREEKASLAQEAGMEYKQINIWFQNRRARSKKDGSSLQRTATFATQLFTSRCSTTSPSPESGLGDACGEDPIHSLEDDAKRQADVLTFDLRLRPAHAFPTPFPSLYAEDPFPVTSGPASFQTPWLRRRVSEPPPKFVVDVEQLTAQIVNLSLSADPSNSYTSPIPSFTLILPRAPLPALIRTATASSRAQPLATLVSATGSSSVSRPWESSKLSKMLPARLPRLSIQGQTTQSSSPDLNSQPITISYSRISGRSRRSPYPHSSRSSSSSSVASSRSSSSSWSAASSIGPYTPSISPRIDMLVFTKDVSSSPTSAHIGRSSSISDGVPISSSLR